jgi:hypothetical protein
VYPLSETPVTEKVKGPLDFVRGELIDATPDVLVVPLAEPLTAPPQVPVTPAPGTRLPLLSFTVTLAIAWVCPPLFGFTVTVKPATDSVDVLLVPDVVVVGVAVMVTLFTVASPELSVTLTLAV